MADRVARQDTRWRLGRNWLPMESAAPWSDGFFRRTHTPCLAPASLGRVMTNTVVRLWSQRTKSGIPYEFNKSIDESPRLKSTSPP